MPARKVAIMRDSYASGPFTRIQFVYKDGQLQIAVPSIHPVGEKGDLVYTITGEYQPRHYY